MTNQSLDEIMSGREEDVSEPVVQQETKPAETVGQQRDDNGRFAPVTDEPVTQETSTEAAVEQKPEGGTVPQQALHAAREREKQARDEAQRYRDQLLQLQGQVQFLTQQPAQQQQPPKPEPTIYDAPDEYLAGYVDPIRQELRDQVETISELMAVQQHGAEAVTEAKQALEAAFRAPGGQQAVQPLYEQLMASKTPYQDLVTWHSQQKAMQDIGSDPAAYRDRIKAEILAELQAQQTAQPAPTNPASKQPMPSNFTATRNPGPRSGAVYSGPQPLSEITRGSSQ